MKYLLFCAALLSFNLVVANTNREPDSLSVTSAVDSNMPQQQLKNVKNLGVTKIIIGAACFVSIPIEYAVGVDLISISVVAFVPSGLFHLISGGIMVGASKRNSTKSNRKDKRGYEYMLRVQAYK